MEQLSGVMAVLSLIVWACAAGVWIHLAVRWGGAINTIGAIACSAAFIFLFLKGLA